jgi:probable addiction module antidote protein
MRLVAFDETLFRELQDDEFAMAYLQDALDDNFEEFLIALGKCVRARGGMTRCAQETGLSREALYRMFQPGANPTMQSVERILRAAGLRLCLRPDAAAEDQAQGIGIAIPSYLHDRLAQQSRFQGVSVDALVLSVLGLVVAQLESGQTMGMTGSLGFLEPGRGDRWSFAQPSASSPGIAAGCRWKERSADLWRAVDGN